MAGFRIGSFITRPEGGTRSIAFASGAWAGKHPRFSQGGKATEPAWASKDQKAVSVAASSPTRGAVCGSEFHRLYTFGLFPSLASFRDRPLTISVKIPT
jgi:hypothetical protein